MIKRECFFRLRHSRGKEVPDDLGSITALKKVLLMRTSDNQIIAFAGSDLNCGGAPAGERHRIFQRPFERRAAWRR